MWKRHLISKFSFSSHSLLFVISGFLRSRPSGTRMVSISSKSLINGKYTKLANIVNDDAIQSILLSFLCFSPALYFWNTQDQNQIQTAEQCVQSTTFKFWHSHSSRSRQTSICYFSSDAIFGASFSSQEMFSVVFSGPSLSFLSFLSCRWEIFFDMLLHSGNAVRKFAIDENIAKGTMDLRYWVIWLIQHLQFKVETSTKFEILAKLQLLFVWKMARNT